jgi:N-methylhydantoinase A
VQAIARTRKPRIARAALAKPDARHAQISVHRIFEDGGWRSAMLYDRSRLRPGNCIVGPAAIAELSATTHLPAGWTTSVDAFSNLILTPKSGARP